MQLLLARFDISQFIGKALVSHFYLNTTNKGSVASDKEETFNLRLPFYTQKCLCLTHLHLNSNSVDSLTQRWKLFLVGDAKNGSFKKQFRNKLFSITKERQKRKEKEKVPKAERKNAEIFSRSIINVLISLKVNTLTRSFHP